MDKSYDLVDVETGNLVGSYSNEDQALRDVVEALEAYGSARISTLALVWADASGARGETIAEGSQLQRLALEHAAHQSRRSA